MTKQLADQQQKVRSCPLGNQFVEREEGAGGEGRAARPGVARKLEEERKSIASDVAKRKDEEYRLRRRKRSTKSATYSSRSTN